MQFENNSAQDTEKTSSAKPNDKKPVPAGFLDFAGLIANVPLGERTLRAEIKKGHLPAIRLRRRSADPF
jgi:hypothetical protein